MGSNWITSLFKAHLMCDGLRPSQSVPPASTYLSLLTLWHDIQIFMQVERAIRECDGSFLAVSSDRSTCIAKRACIPLCTTCPTLYLQHLALAVIAEMGYGLHD